MNPDIERLCRAVYAELKKMDPHEYVGPDSDLTCVCLDGDFDLSAVVRAILTEAREPSTYHALAGAEVANKHTLGKAGDMRDFDCEYDVAVKIWQAMIDHLLRDSDE